MLWRYYISCSLCNYKKTGLSTKAKRLTGKELLSLGGGDAFHAAGKVL